MTNEWSNHDRTYWHALHQTKVKMMSGPFPKCIYSKSLFDESPAAVFFSKEILRHRANNNTLSSFSTVIKYLGDTKQQIIHFIFGLSFSFIFTSRLNLDKSLRFSLLMFMPESKMKQLR